MLSVSNAFNEAFRSPTRRVLTRITMNGVVYANNDVFSVSYESGSITGESFSIGSTFSNSIKITFSKIIEGVKQLDKIKLEFGIVLADGTNEYVSMGYFFVDSYDPDRNENRTIIEAYDAMSQMEGVYESELTYPDTLLNVATEIANKSGMTIDTASFQRLPSKTIAKIEGKTYRQAIGLIAQFACGFVTFNREGKLAIRTLSDPNFSVSTSDYFSKGLSKDETMYRLNGINCKVKTSNSEESTLQSGIATGNQISLENDVMTQIYLDDIYQQLKDLNYYPFTLSWRGNPALEAGDWISMADTKENSFKMPNLSYKLEFSGGLKATSSAETKSVASSTVEYKGNLTQKVAVLEGWKNASGGWTYTGLEEPINPRENDVWFKPNGPDTETWLYENGKWVFKTSTAGITEAKKAADEAKALGEEAKQAGEEAKVLGNEALVAGQNAVDKATTADSNASTALTNANSAVEKATQASQKADTSATTANEAKTQAANAVTNANTALANANKAVKDVGDLSGIVTTNTADIDKLEDAIVLKADTTTVDAVTGRVSTAEGKITTMAGQVALKANQSDVDAVEGRVSATEASLTLQDGKITTLTTKTDGLDTSLSSLTQDYNGFKTTVYSKTQTDTKIATVQSTVDNFKTTVSSTYSSKAETDSKVKAVQANVDKLGTNIAYAWSPDGKDRFTRVKPEPTQEELAKDYDNAVPRYIGRSLKNSTNPADFKFEPNPERKPWTVYAQDVNGKDFSLMPYGEQLLSNTGFVKSNNWIGVTSVSDGVATMTKSSTTPFRKFLQTEIFGYSISNLYTSQVEIYIESSNNSLKGSGSSWLLRTLDSSKNPLNAFDYRLDNLELNKWIKLEQVNKSLSSKTDTSNALEFTIAMGNNFVGTVKIRKPKLELANIMGIPTPWTPAPSEDPLGAIPKYVGTAALPYEEWTKYDWRLSSDWNEVKTSTSIDQTNKAIILKADQTTVNEVTGRVTTVEGKITLLSDRMNFRITNSDGSITQIDLANKVISLSGEQVNITGNTYIANGVIKTAAIADLAVSNAKIANLAVSEGKIADLAVTNAKIANLAVSTAKIADLAVTNAKIGSISADKINVGTLNAANVNIINLNANNITSGTISGTNLSINLTTGVVNFKKGRINSASNNIDINIDAGYFSVADSSTRVIIKGGELQFVSPTIFDLDTNPYLSIDNSGGSQGFYGASIVGRDFISLANKANNSNMFDTPIGLETFAGISFGRASGSWRPTKIGGAERGIVLSGGAALSDSLDSFKGSPRIVIGSDVAGQAGGNRIYILGEYIQMRSVYTKTTSTAANVVVATDGALVRSTSASKYKSDIQRFYDTSIGEKLLDLPYATWLDKAEMQRYSENPTLPIPRKNFGMIAEDLADAGLEELVVRGENNQLEGIQYERLAVALIPVIRELKQEIETLKARVA